MGAALATVLGCFLPWAKVAFVTLDGTDAGDFPLFLIAGGLLTWTAVARKPVGVIVLSAILILLWFAEYASIQDEEPGAISVSIGAGLWMILAGAVTALVAGIISRRARG